MTSPRKKSPTAQYTGPLAEPHVRTPVVGNLLAYAAEAEKRAREADFDALSQKVSLLIDHYKARRDDGAVNWRWLALELAFDHVPGFQVIDKPKRGRGRPRKEDGFELYRTILEVLDERQTSVSNACRILCKRSGPWRGKNPTTLETRFHAVKQKLIQRERFIVDTFSDVPEAASFLAESIRAGDESRPSAKYPKPFPDDVEPLIPYSKALNSYGKSQR